MVPIIKVTTLSKNFKDIIAVDRLSFTVAQGDVFGFLGKNGAGKSTTIRMLLSLIEPTSGNIEIFGMELKSHRREILKQVGAVIEKPDVYKYLTAFENLKLFSTISGVPKVNRIKLMDQLEMVGLHSRAHSKVKNFSQGMKQRLGIAIALVHDPKLIILDEPTNGLDPQGIADMRNLIIHLSQSLKKTILVSSHLLNEIELIANRLLIIDEGKKMVEGNTATLFDPLYSIIELDTLDNVSALEIINQSIWAEYIQPSGSGKIILKMEKYQIPVFNRALVSMQIQVLSLQPRHSLEDYFIQITTGNKYVEAFKD